MAGTETIHPIGPKIGRDYNPSLVDASFLHKVEGKFIEDLSGSEESTVSAIIDYVVSNIKRGSPTLSYDDIISNRVHGINRFGVIELVSSHAYGFDFVGKDGNIIIPGDAKLSELIIPTVDFTRPREATNKVIIPKIVSQSLGQVANVLKASRSDTQFVFGLTHPRMGQIAQDRWGFHLEENPFPTISYKFFDYALEIPDCDQVDREGIQRFRSQVLVYQPIAEFLQRAA